MKRIMICAMLLILAATSFSQTTEPTTPSTPLTSADYLKKSKAQKTFGFILLGVGAVTLVSISGGNTDLNSVGTLAGIGVASALGSIPLFIASGRNKRKAKNASVSFKLEKIPAYQQAGISSGLLPAVAIKLKLGS